MTLSVLTTKLDKTSEKTGTVQPQMANTPLPIVVIKAESESVKRAKGSPRFRIDLKAAVVDCCHATSSAYASRTVIVNMP